MVSGELVWFVCFFWFSLGFLRFFSKCRVLRPSPFPTNWTGSQKKKGPSPFELILNFPEFCCAHSQSLENSKLTQKVRGRAVNLIDILFLVNEMCTKVGPGGRPSHIYIYIYQLQTVVVSLCVRFLR